MLPNTTVWPIAIPYLPALEDTVTAKGFEILPSTPSPNQCIALAGRWRCLRDLLSQVTVRTPTPSSMSKGIGRACREDPYRFGVFPRHESGAGEGRAGERIVLTP